MLTVFHSTTFHGEQIGIVPDIYVEETIEDLQNNKDAILEAAIKAATE